jgi:large subunit ribosomal protein L6
MSRIGKKLIEIPKDVNVVIEDGQVTVKGKYGTLEKGFNKNVTIEKQENQLSVKRNSEIKSVKSYHGLTRALIQNMVFGVDQKFSKVLIAKGVGYKFQIEGKALVLSMGYSHPINFDIPNDLEIKLESPTKIIISGIEKEKVGFLAAKIREVRPPEPYKGKGIMYENEKIIRKAGKTGK